MILDSLDNYIQYREFPYEIFKCITYLKGIEKNIDLGIYHISEISKLIIEEYKTKIKNEGLFEAHKNVIDIQYPITGIEQVEWAPLYNMIQVSDYDVMKDRTYFSQPSHINKCVIGNGIFAIFFPGDAHNPQLGYLKGPEFIKKGTIKITIST